MRRIAVAFLLFVACASTDPRIRRMQEYRAAQDRRDTAAMARYIAPGARIWYEKKEGLGEPYTTAPGRWAHWDEFFGSKTALSNWRVVDGKAVAADGIETNEFMRLLEWEPKPWTITWWLDEEGRIKEVMLKASPERPKSRLEEFKAWARKNRPEELAYLMPNNRIDPTGDRPERWKVILQDWRATLH